MEFIEDCEIIGGVGRRPEHKDVFDGGRICDGRGLQEVVRREIVQRRGDVLVCGQSPYSDFPQLSVGYP